jgi:hypothetical protein
MSTVMSAPLLFNDWMKAAKAGFRTNQQWLEQGRRVKKGTPAAAEMDAGESVCKLYRSKDTKPMQVDLACRYHLIRRFVRYTEMFGYQPFGKDRIVQLPTESIFGNLRQLLYRSFDYKTRKQGVRVPIKYRGRHQSFAERFHIRGTKKMQWFVLDLDNHSPTSESTHLHLQLLTRIQNTLPTLLKDLGGGSVFYDYRMDSPTGIHVWVVLKKEYETTVLHARVRKFLSQISDPGLDKTLAAHGLRRCSEIEIRPTENQLIAFFGCSGNEVFTTEPLKPKNTSFDALSLHSHINLMGTTVADVVSRYGDLAHLACESPGHLFLKSVDLNPQVLLASTLSPTTRGPFFRDLLDLALRGVLVPDDLFAVCLRLLAQALYFREFHNAANKDRLVVDLLMEWLENKHNGHVSRIINGKTRDLRNQVVRVVGKIKNTPAPIQAYWERVRENDWKYPTRTISIISAMKTPWDRSVVSSNMSLDDLRGILASGSTNIKNYCIAGHFTSPPTSQTIIPTVVLDKLDEAISSGTRKRKACERKRRFCVEFIKLIGQTGERRISQKTLNQLAGYEPDDFPKTIRRYKKFLQDAVILKPGSYRGILRGKASSLYKLEDWVIEAWNQQGSALG